MDIPGSVSTTAVTADVAESGDTAGEIGDTAGESGDTAGGVGSRKAEKRKRGPEAETSDVTSGCIQTPAVHLLERVDGGGARGDEVNANGEPRYPCPVCIVNPDTKCYGNVKTSGCVHACAA